tara:strand:+ start:493 stop:1029 length:537 start_codon:yes stop_codon:yes gene_type:complete
MKAFGLILVILSLGIWTGCVGYVAGPTNGLPAGAQSVRVEFFKNETLEPRLVVAVNRALKRNLQQDGTYTLETRGNADLVVTGELTEFLRNGVSYTPGDSLTVKDYSMSLTAHIKVTRPGTGEVVYEGEITGNSTVRVGNDLTAGQRQAVPIIADHLARQATSFIVDGKWPEAAAAAP